MPSLPLDFVQVLLRDDLPYLFVSFALLTVALIGLGAAVTRRERERLLVWFSIFAGLYGLRLLLQRDLFTIVFYHSAGLQRWRDALDYLVPVPAMVYFYRGGFLTRAGKVLAVIVGAMGMVLCALVFVIGPRGVLHTINNVAIVIALLQFLFSFWLPRARDGQSLRELRIVRYGLIAFIALALWDNVAGLARMTWPRIEPVGFVMFIGCLGFVTAQRAFAREERLLTIEKELDIARRIQQSILPGEFPASARLTVAARYLPMTSVAGDFYDYVIAEPERAAILIADVSGHGVPAALIASMVKLAAASQRDVAHEPAKLLAGMNAALVGNTQTQFATAACVYFDLAKSEARYAAAAHPPMLRLRAGVVERIEENGLMLAAFDFAAYEQKTLPLEAGDRFVLYTDGVVEAANAAGEEFGATRLEEQLRDSATLAPDAAADALAAAVSAWSPAQEDDITVIVCDVGQG